MLPQNAIKHQVDVDSIPARYPECEKGLNPVAAIHNHHSNF